MTTALTPFQSGAGLPAHLADLNEQGNIELRESIPQLSFRGKVWRIVIGGEETIVMRPDGEPSSVVVGVILDYNKARSRAYFDKPYVEGQTFQPTCWSHDGVLPHEQVQQKQANTCASCPQSKKGSRITPDGKQVTACSQFKRAAFVPINDTAFSPLLLKMPQTSMWDKDGAEMAAKGAYAWDQYVQFLKQRGINHTANVVTKIRFDPRVAYPKLLFSAVDYLPETAIADIRVQLAKVDELNTILSVDPAGGEVDDSGDIEDAGASAAPPAPAAKPAATAKPAKPAAPAPAPAPAPAAVVEEPATITVDPDDIMPAPFGAGAKPVAAAPAAASAAVTKPSSRTAKAAAAAAPAPAAAKAAPTAQVVAAGDAKAKEISDLLADWDKE